MTENELKARVSLAIDLITAANQVLDEIKSGNTDMFRSDLTNMFSSDSDILIHWLEEMKHCDGMENEILVGVPHLKYGPCGSIETGIMYPDGSRLSSFFSESDCGTYQAGAHFTYNDGSLQDLCMVEIKKGDLAEIHGLSADNKDIDMYVWADPVSDDFTQKLTIKRTDIDGQMKKS